MASHITPTYEQIKMIKVQNNIAVREPIPKFLTGLDTQSLSDLSWTDPALGVSGFGWWPEYVQIPAIDDAIEKYGDEILTADQKSKTVIVNREVIQLTQAEITEKLQSAISAKLTEIDRLAKSKRDAIIADYYSPGEMASWPIKRAEALAYQSAAAATDADAPALAAEAAVRGITTSDLVTKVLTNSALLINLEAQIAGTAGKHRDAVAAMTTTQSVRGYDITANWPV